MDADLAFIIISLIALIALLALGTYFSAAEMAFSSLSRARVKSMEDVGGKKGRRAKVVSRLYENNFDSIISTLLICNNLVAIASATVSVALFVRLIGEWGYLVSTVAVSAIIIMFTDIFPKSMAKEQPERVALACIPFVKLLMILLRPINTVIFLIKKALDKAFVPDEADLDGEESSLHGQELIYMVEEAGKKGAFDLEDSILITNAIEFNDLTAWDIITPRVDIVSMPLSAGIDEAVELFLTNGYSRIPVYEENLDNIKGVVHLRDLLKTVASNRDGDPAPLADIIAPAVFTVTSARITELLKQLKDEKSHMAIVTDEYGGTEGIVTMDDILERLVGDIWDEADEVIDEFVSLGDGKYTILCNSYIDDMFAYFGVKAESESNTVGGWIMDMLRRIPEVGDSFVFKNLKVTVTKTGQHRAEECLVEVK